MPVIKAPHTINTIENKFSVFLAGSIEKGLTENWQQQIENALSDCTQIYILNPRRDEWNDEWEDKKENAQFHKQVSWELDGLEKAAMIIFYFSAQTQSPVSMLELGLAARSGKALVYCPDGFWRKGNIDMVCERYNIPQVNNMNEIIQQIKIKSQTV